MIKTVEETDTAIERMHKAVAADSTLKKQLILATHWKERWKILEKYILGKLKQLNIAINEYENLWIRERFFYEQQQQTKLDYGICSHFHPTYRNKAKSLLTDNLKLDLSEKCSHGGRTLETTCNGTDRDICVILHPKTTEARRNPSRYN